jgi:antirestriction protein
MVRRRRQSKTAKGVVMSERLQPPTPEDGEVIPEGVPSFFVANIPDLRNGVRIGRWIDATMSVEQMTAEIAEVVADPSESDTREWAIVGFLGFGQIPFSMTEPIERLGLIARELIRWGDPYHVWAKYQATKGWKDLEDFEARYFGEWRSLGDFAENYLTDLGLMDQIHKASPVLALYVKVGLEDIGKDMVLNGEILTTMMVEGDDSFFVFRG